MTFPEAHMRETPTILVVGPAARPLADLLGPGHDVLLASGMEEARQRGAQQPVDLLVLDQSMLPDLLACPEPCPPVAVLAQDPEKAARALAHWPSPHAVLAKPVSAARLQLRLQSLLPASLRRAMPVDPVVLVVDDDPHALPVLVDRVTDLGATVLPCTSAAEALPCLDVVEPDLILSDVIMPGMDGYEFCRYIRSMPALDHVPVALLSGLTTQLRERSLEVGADDAFSKAEDSATFRVRIRTLIRLGCGRARNRRKPGGELVVLVSNEPGFLVQMQVQLLTDGATVRAFPDLESAWEVLPALHPDLLLVDLDSLPVGGESKLHDLRETPWGQRLALAACASRQQADRLNPLERVLDDRIIKPTESPELRHRIHLLLDLATLRSVPAPVVN